MKIIVFGQIAVYLVNMLTYVMFAQNFVGYLQFVPALILNGQVSGAPHGLPSFTWAVWCCLWCWVWRWAWAR